MNKNTAFGYTKGGYFHMCVTDPDPDGLLKRAVEKGAKQIGETADLAEGEQAGPWGQHDRNVGLQH